MRIPHLVWRRRHNIAVLTVSYAGRVWHTREVGDLVLGFNATGRLSRVVLLDPGSLLPPSADVGEAIEIVTEVLLRARAIRQAELDVLRSALDRVGTREMGPNTGPFPLAPNRTPSPSARSRARRAAP